MYDYLSLSGEGSQNQIMPAVKSAGNASLVVLIIQNFSAVQANLMAWDIVGQITLQHLAHPFIQQGHKPFFLFTCKLHYENLMV